MGKKKPNATDPAEHSPKFELVKRYYDEGLWKKKAVWNAVGRGWITPAEYEEIVGEPYNE